MVPFMKVQYDVPHPSEKETKPIHSSLYFSVLYGKDAQPLIALQLGIEIYIQSVAAPSKLPMNVLPVDTFQSPDVCHPRIRDDQ